MSELSLGVEPAFYFVGSGPTAGAWIFAFGHWQGAGSASDGWVSLLGQWVDDEVMISDVRLYLFVSPGHDGVDLEAPGAVNLEHWSGCSLSLIHISEPTRPAA